MTIDTFIAALQGEEKIDEIRLNNWGYWNRINAYPDFEPAGWMKLWREYIKTFHVAHSVAEQDAVIIADAISTMDMICRANKDPLATGIRQWGSLSAFILKVVYAEQYDRPAIILAEDVARKFRIRCSRRTFFRHLSRAKHHLFTIAPSIQ